MINKNKKLQQSASLKNQIDEFESILESKFGGQGRPMTQSEEENMFTEEQVDQFINNYLFG